MMQISLTLLSPTLIPSLPSAPLSSFSSLSPLSAAENGFKLSECLTCSNARMRAVSSLTLAFHDKSKKRSFSFDFSVTCT